MAIEPKRAIRPGHYVRCRSLSWTGRVDTVFVDNEGNACAAMLEAQGGGWIAAPLDDLVPAGAGQLH